MDIKKYLKPGMDIVIELDDEVEYLLGDAAVQAIEKGDERIILKRIFDHQDHLLNVARIEKALKQKETIDYVLKSPLCPECGEPMLRESKDFTHNSKTGIKYDRAIYICKAHDIWTSIELPEKISN